MWDCAIAFKPHISTMPAPKTFTEILFVRLQDGARQRIEALQKPGEKLSETQRRVVMAGLDVLENNPLHKPKAQANKSRRR